MKARPCIVPDLTGNRIAVRSRLEAQWARFFSLSHIKWVYEPEVTSTFYRPDFLTPHGYIEIKPSWHQAAQHLQKYQRFSLLYHPAHLFLFCASPRGLFTQVAIFQNGIDSRLSPHETQAIFAPDLSWTVLNCLADQAANYSGEPVVSIGELLTGFKFLNPFLP